MAKMMNKKEREARKLMATAARGALELKEIVILPFISMVNISFDWPLISSSVERVMGRYFIYLFNNSGGEVM